MSQEQETTPSPVETLTAATELGVMNLRSSQPLLVGTFVTPESATALLRLNTGKIRRVALGDRIGQAEVVRIEEGVVDLSLHSQVLSLHLPDAA